MRASCIAIAIGDGMPICFIPACALMFGGMIGAACLDVGNRTVGIVILTLSALITLSGALLGACGLIRGVKISHMGGYYDGVQPAHVWSQYRHLSDPVLRSAAEPLWRAFVVACRAYGITEDAAHLKDAQERARRIAQLAEVQAKAEKARALVAAGATSGSTDDLEQADAFLRSLKELG